MVDNFKKSKKRLEIENFERYRRVKQFKKVLVDFRRMGFEIQEIEPFKFRIHDWIEVMPVTREFYDIKKKVKGKIKGISFNNFLREFFGLKI